VPRRWMPRWGNPSDMLLAGNSVQIMGNSVVIKGNSIVIAGPSDNCCCGSGSGAPPCSACTLPSTITCTISGTTACAGCNTAYGMTSSGSIDGTYILTYNTRFTACRWTSAGYNSGNYYSGCVGTSPYIDYSEMPTFGGLVTFYNTKSSCSGGTFLSGNLLVLELSYTSPHWSFVAVAIPGDTPDMFGNCPGNTTAAPYGFAAPSCAVTDNGFCTGSASSLTMTNALVSGSCPSSPPDCIYASTSPAAFYGGTATFTAA